ncbi:MAG TPA: hypothetical protein VNY84_06255, partial [Acidimicrobiales bacterium]|nr:hypothetical protein [Acidimicrobiales bacterium]
MTSAITDAAVVPIPERAIGEISDPEVIAVVDGVLVAESVTVIDAVPVAEPLPLADPISSLVDPLTVSVEPIDPFPGLEPAEGPVRAWLLAVVLVGLVLAVALTTLAMVVARRVPSSSGNVSVAPAAAGGFL